MQSTALIPRQALWQSWGLTKSALFCRVCLVLLCWAMLGLTNVVCNDVHMVQLCVPPASYTSGFLCGLCYLYTYILVARTCKETYVVMIFVGCHKVHCPYI